MPEILWTPPANHQAAVPAAQTVVNASDFTVAREVSAGATGTPTATSSLSGAPLGDLKMSLVLRKKSGGGTTPDPGPTPDPTPGTDPTTVKIGTATFPLAAVNPTATSNPLGADYPGYRGPNQLVEYKTPVTVTVTNQYGCEVQVNSSNVVTAVNDRQVTGDTTGTSVPSGGYVLSGHGTARSWLLTNAVVSATVELTAETNPTPGGGGDPAPNPSGYPAKVAAIYKKVWSSDTPVTAVPDGGGEIRIAFAQGSPPALVGGTSAGTSSMVASLAARRAAGTKIVVSAGGSKGSFSTSNRTAVMQGIASIKAILEGSAGGGLDGFDWDIEASALNQADVLWISTQLKQLYGSNFAITMAPNGSNWSTYLPCAVELYKNNALDHYGHQFYDAVVSLSAAKGRISDALGAGLPQSVMGVGMALSSTTAGGYWSNDTCRTYMADIRATWPGITKCYLWAENSDLTAAATWVANMRAVIGF